MPDIDTIRDILSPVFKDYHIKRAVLFGSYAKGTASEKSDIDLYVDSGLKGLRFYGFLEDVSVLLNKRVDLIDASQVMEGSKISEEIEKTGVVIYGNEGSRSTE